MDKTDLKQKNTDNQNLQPKGGTNQNVNEDSLKGMEPTPIGNVSVPPFPQIISKEQANKSGAKETEVKQNIKDTIPPVITANSIKTTGGGPKHNKRMMVATILGLFLLLGGLGAGLILTQQKQNIREKAAGDTITCGGVSCPPEDCHCQGGDACTSLKCEPGQHQSCINQGRSWCKNYKGYKGYGMTCCVRGYICNPNGDGCVPGDNGGGGNPWCTEGNNDCTGHDIGDSCGNGGICEDNNNDHLCGCHGESNPTPTPTPTSVPRPNLCDSLTLSNNVLGPNNESITATAKSNKSNITRFSLAFYNKDNLSDPNDPRTSKPIWFVDSQHYIMGYDSTGSSTHTFTVNYEDVNRPDHNYNDKYPIHIGLTAYFTNEEGFSAPDPKCVRDVTVQESVTPTPTATPTPSCNEVRAYTVNENDIGNVSSWTKLSTQDLSNLHAGDVIYITVVGHSSSNQPGGGFDKAELFFGDYDTSLGESINLKPKEAGSDTSGISEFYFRYTIPDNKTDFTFLGKIHYIDTNEWF